MDGGLIQTKLSIPRVRGSLVQRPRLLERLDEGLGAKLTLVSAPAGYGKTTPGASTLGISKSLGDREALVKARASSFGLKRSH